MNAPACPQPHFPSPYERPHTAPVAAMAVPTADGAAIATFVYAPAGYGDSLEQALASGEPVLMLHGNGEEHGIFGPAIESALAAGHPVVALDSRAQGKSTRGTAPLTYELMAADALSALDRLGVAQAHVVGFSDGAIEGLIMARDYPDRVASLLSIGANLTPDGVIEEDDWDIEASARELEDWANYLLDHESVKEGAQGEKNVDTSLLTPTPAEALCQAELLRLMLCEPQIEAAGLGAITCPTTIMVGEFDCIAPAETVAIVRGIRGGGNGDVRITTVAGAGHTLPKHAAEAVNQAMHDLLARASR